jgi:hypothetical protein
VIYNQSDRELSKEDFEVLAKGMNFSFSQKRFPIMDLIASTESLCQFWETVVKTDEVIIKAEKTRMIVMEQLQKFVKRPIKRNLSKKQRAILKSLRNDDSIVICSADKGRAIVILNRNDYIKKSEDQIKEGDYVLVERDEASIIKDIQDCFKAQLKEMGIKDWEERRKWLVTTPSMARMYLLIKVHKNGFPGRAVVDQTDDPSYKICKELSKILGPLARKSKAYIENAVDLEKRT